MAEDIPGISRQIIRCRACPRLVQWREEIAQNKVKRYRNEVYWGRPVPSWGDDRARLMLVGLAPAAHGGNRTGRMFTGDASGDWLIEALYHNGFANQPRSESVTDGLILRDVYITAAVHCVPPLNRPTRQELAQCRPFLAREIAAIRPRVLIALGHIAFDAIKKALTDLSFVLPPMVFSHAAHYSLKSLPSFPLDVVASYHPSRQNTQTGRLTHEMFQRVFCQARAILSEDCR
ncbi:MAG: uracil-DNA glycosylase [Firmicutes bacterium]|nr:uracil-DNA glycosylase [Bacillota bacterium]